MINAADKKKCKTILNLDYVSTSSKNYMKWASATTFNCNIFTSFQNRIFVISLLINERIKLFMKEVISML